MMTRVLIVDDSRVDRLLIGGLIEAAGDLEVEYAADGAEALAAIEARRPDVVVTDLVMPGVDGLELVAQVTQDHPSVPVVLVTSHGSEEIAAQALRRGAASYVPKSYLARDLVETLERILETVSERQAHAEVLASLVRGDWCFELENERLLFGSMVAYIQESLARVRWGDENLRRQIGVALEEALVNASEHGNLELDSDLREDDRGAYLELARERCAQSPYCERRVRLEVRIEPAEIRFTVGDQGKGFDPSQLPDPTDAKNLLKSSGRGVMLMRTFMDEVRYNDQGTEVTLVKRADPEAAADGN